MRFETLYTIKDPTELDRAEYYQPQLETVVFDGKPAYTVKEKHAWYDDALKTVKHNRYTLQLDASEAFATYEEAERRFLQQIEQRAREGFVHSFYYEFEPDGPKQRYRLITI